MPDDRLKTEICIESVAGATAAAAAGADRVELCASLLEGGTTPSAGTIAVVRGEVEIGLHVIIRPRGGDFCYTEPEFEVMKRDVRTAAELGADGVVIGILDPDGSVDLARTRELVALAQPMSVTFHRAFDMLRDPVEALEQLIHLGIDRVLTSGQEATVLEGLALIRELVIQAGERIVVMPGGGITARNVARIVRDSGVREIHFACRTPQDSPMRYRNPNAFMGGELRPPEFAVYRTSADGVLAVIRNLP